jgi:hypothetical protein
MGPGWSGWPPGVYLAQIAGSSSSFRPPAVQVLREDHQVQELLPAKVLAAAPVKVAKLDEAMAKYSVRLPGSRGWSTLCLG